MSEHRDVPLRAFVLSLIAAGALLSLGSRASAQDGTRTRMAEGRCPWSETYCPDGGLAVMGTCACEQVEQARQAPPAAPERRCPTASDYCADGSPALMGACPCADQPSGAPSSPPVGPPATQLPPPTTEMANTPPAPAPRTDPQPCPDGSSPVNGTCGGRICHDGSFTVNGRCPRSRRWGRRGSERPTGDADLGTHSDGGLIATGAILLGVGYGVSVTFGVLGDNFILFIPVAGGFIHAPVNGTEGGIALGLSVSGAQLIGLIVLIAGAAHHHPNEPAQASLVPELVPGPGEAGVGLRWAF